MDIHVLALAFIAVTYTLVVLVTGNPLVSLWGTYGRRPDVAILYRTHGDKSNRYP